MYTNTFTLTCYTIYKNIILEPNKNGLFIDIKRRTTWLYDFILYLPFHHECLVIGFLT